MTFKKSQPRFTLRTAELRVCMDHANEMQTHMQMARAVLAAVAAAFPSLGYL